MTSNFSRRCLRGLAAWLCAGLPLGAAAAPPPPNGVLYDLLGAPADWSISGNFRLRGEGIDNTFRPAPVATSTGALLLRTSLFAEYHPGPLHAGLEVIDSRVYFEGGRSAVSTSEVNAVELSQAYIGWRAPETLGIPGLTDITAGRFTMDDGSRRLIARNQFRNTVNAFTGVRAEWSDGPRYRVNLFWTMPQIRLPTDAEKLRENAAEFDLESTDQQFYGGSVTLGIPLEASLELYAYRLEESDRPDLPSRNRALTTPGARLFRAPQVGAIDWDLEGVYQTGHQRATTAPTDRKDLATDAYFYHLEAGYTLAAPWQPRVSVKYDQASGNGHDPNRYDRFDTLFGARVFDLGPTSFYGAIQRSNVRDVTARLEVTPNPRFDLQTSARALWLQTPTDSFAATGVRDRRGLSGTFAGYQIEWRARYWVMPKRLMLDGGMAFLLKGRFLTDAPNAPQDGDTTYAYLAAIFPF